MQSFSLDLIVYNLGLLLGLIFIFFFNLRNINKEIVVNFIAVNSICLIYYNVGYYFNSYFNFYTENPFLYHSEYIIPYNLYEGLLHLNLYHNLLFFIVIISSILFLYFFNSIAIYLFYIFYFLTSIFIFVNIFCLDVFNYKYYIFHLLIFNLTYITIYLLSIFRVLNQSLYLINLKLTYVFIIVLYAFTYNGCYINIANVLYISFILFIVYNVFYLLDSKKESYLYIIPILYATLNVLSLPFYSVQDIIYFVFLNLILLKMSSTLLRY